MTTAQRAHVYTAEQLAERHNCTMCSKEIGAEETDRNLIADWAHCDDCMVKFNAALAQRMAIEDRAWRHYATARYRTAEQGWQAMSESGRERYLQRARKEIMGKQAT